MSKTVRTALLSLLLFSLCGCSGYRAYPGMHGASIKLHPDVHDLSSTVDNVCLSCHHPDDPQGPPTPHPGFSGCINCHNDEV